VDTEYIGAHFITLFYNRNLKIYSNMLRAQQQSQAERVLAVFGVAHVGVLEELFAANPAYHVVHAATYLKTKKTKLLHLAKSASK
jgi:pheromone shutdown protein TraB